MTLKTRDPAWLSKNFGEVEIDEVFLGRIDAVRGREVQQPVVIAAGIHLRLVNGSVNDRLIGLAEVSVGVGLTAGERNAVGRVCRRGEVDAVLAQGRQR